MGCNDQNPLIPLWMGYLQTIASSTNVARSSLSRAVGNIMRAFLVSIIAGCFLPMLPIMAEYGLTHAVQGETWSLTGVVYAAAVGMASRNQAVVISGLFCSAICAAIYGAEKLGEANNPYMPFIEYGPVIAQSVLYFFIIGYCIERFGRHCVDKRPYVEC